MSSQDVKWVLFNSVLNNEDILPTSRDAKLLPQRSAKIPDWRMSKLSSKDEPSMTRWLPWYFRPRINYES
jgi:hypothetical protein